MPTTPPAAEPRIQYSSLRQGPGDYSTHYSGLRGVRHRWIGVLLPDCAAQERWRSRTPMAEARGDRSWRFRPRLAPGVPEGAGQGRTAQLADPVARRVPWVSRP